MNLHPHIVAKNMQQFSKRMTNFVIGSLAVGIFLHSFFEFVGTAPVLLAYAVFAVLLIVMVSLDIMAAIIILSFDAIRSIRAELGYEQSVECIDCARNTNQLIDWHKNQ